MDGGYVLNNGGAFTEYYNGRDIPDEYRVFAYPQPEKSIQKAIANYQQMISDAPAASERPHPDHTER